MDIAAGLFADCGNDHPAAALPAFHPFLDADDHRPGQILFVQALSHTIIFYFFASHNPICAITLWS